jgi:hypothetical protein
MSPPVRWRAIEASFRRVRGPCDGVPMAQPLKFPTTMTDLSRADDTLPTDEARRAAHHEAVKTQVEDDVNAEIGAKATLRPSGAVRKVEQVADTLRRHAVEEVVDSERSMRRSRGVARLSQFIDYAFFLIYALLAVRFVLVLIAARSTSGFVEFIVRVTSPLYEPFEGIVASTKTGDGHTVMLPLLVAIGAYVVLHIAINRLLRLVAVRKTEI